MKAVVVEIEGKNAIVLNKNGEFVKIKNNGNLKIGYEVEMPAAKVFTLNQFMKAAAIAAAFLLVTGISIGAYSYSQPYSYINVDINPSVEFTTNRFDRIIDAKGLNEDGEKLLELSSYKNKDIEEGIQNILKSATDEGYIKDESVEAVMVTVSGTDEKKVEKIEQEVKAAAEKSLGDEAAKEKVMVEKTSLEKRNDAQKMGISPGKLNLINKAIQENPELKVEDLKNAPVKDIMKRIHSSRKQNKQEIGQEKTGSKTTSTTNRNITTHNGNPDNNGRDGRNNDKQDDKYNDKRNNAKKPESTVKEPVKRDTKPAEHSRRPDNNRNGDEADEDDDSRDRDGQRDKDRGSEKGDKREK